jgi:chromosome segregation ATPase
LAKLKPTDIMAYEESLKVYRDLKAVTDSAHGDGYKEAAEKFGIEIVEERRQKEEAIKKKEEAIKKQEEAIKKEEEAIKKQEEAIKKQEEAIKKQEEAIKKQEEAIKKQEEAIKKQEEAIKLMVLNGISKETISATLGVSIERIDQIMKS